MKKSNWISLFVVFAGAVNAVGTLLVNLAQSKQQEVIIEEKIKEALSK